MPVFSLESAMFHPMQGLADLLVLRNHLLGDPAEHTVAVTWAYHPKPLPMAVASRIRRVTFGIGRCASSGA